MADDLKAGAAAAIAVSGFLGIYTPHLLATRQCLSDGVVRNILTLAMAAGAGVLISTGIVHVIPDAAKDLEEVLEGDPYPYAFMIVTMSILIMYCVENELHHTLHRNSSSASPRAATTAHVLEIGIAVHSVIIGIALGALADASSVQNLMIAMVFHQLSEGFALGSTIAKGKLGMWHSAVLMGFFCLSLPAGIGIGVALTTWSDPESRDQKLALGVLSSVSAGILVYMGCVEFLGHLFPSHHADLGSTSCCDTHADHRPHPLVVEGQATTDPAEMRDCDYKSNQLAEPDHHHGHSHGHGHDDDDHHSHVHLHVDLVTRSDTEIPTTHTTACIAETPLWLRLASYASMGVGAGIMCVLALWA